MPIESVSVTLSAMRNRRLRLIWGGLIVVGVLLGAFVAYQSYYRSNRYRLRIERALTSFFGLPTDVESIRPESFTSRELMNVQMWLPERRARIFWCPRAVWDASGDNADVDGTVLHLYQPVLSIGSEAWKSEDYMRVLKASLLHNFSELNIRRVQFHDGHITWPRRDLNIRVDGVNGIIDFDKQGQGKAVLTSTSLNENKVVEPIQINARIDPANEQDFLPEVSLMLPPLPLRTLGLDQMLGSSITQGVFSGSIKLMQSPGNDTVELVGAVQDIRLDEFTKRMQGGPLSGLVDLTIHRAMIRGRKLESLRFNGKARDVMVDPLLRRFGLPEIGGKVQLEVLNGRVQNEVVQGMSISGQWQGGSLAALSQALLKSASIHGQVSVAIKSLVIKENELVSGEIDVNAKPPPGRPGTITKSVLLDLMERYLGFTISEMVVGMLPDSVEFVRARAKLLIEHHKLQILPVLNSGDDALLTIRIGGQELPLIRNIDQTYDLTPLIERARKQAGQLKEKLQKRQSPASKPASTAPA